MRVEDILRLLEILELLLGKFKSLIDILDKIYLVGHVPPLKIVQQLGQLLNEHCEPIEMDDGKISNIFF
jgi:hypothetical protein